MWTVCFHGTEYVPKHAALHTDSIEGLMSCKVFIMLEMFRFCHVTIRMYFIGRIVLKCEVKGK